MGNNFLCHPSWFRLAVWQFCIFQTFLFLQPIAEDLWQLIHVHIHECDHWLFTMILLQVWFNNEAYKTKEGYFNLSKQINNSVTDFRAALTCQLFVFWEAFPKSHYLFYIWPHFYHPILTHLLSTHRVAQKYNGHTSDFVTTWKSSLWAGKSCNRLNPLLKMSFMPQDCFQSQI